MIAVIVMITLQEPYSTNDPVIGGLMVGVKPIFRLIGLTFDIFQFHFCFLCRSALLHIELLLRRISFIVLIAYHHFQSFLLLLTVAFKREIKEHLTYLALATLLLNKCG